MGERLKPFFWDLLNDLNREVANVAGISEWLLDDYFCNPMRNNFEDGWFDSFGIYIGRILVDVHLRKPNIRIKGFDEKAAEFCLERGLFYPKFHHEIELSPIDRFYFTVEDGQDPREEYLRKSVDYLRHDLEAYGKFCDSFTG